jgi:Protein of unknown function (DUF2997)
MQYYKVEFTINSDGTVTEKVIASGPNCTAVTNELEGAIGEIISQEMLPESQLNLIDMDEDLTQWQKR